MAQKTKLEMQIEAAQKRIRQGQTRLKELETEQKQNNKKIREHRLCKRHGLLESFLPITIDFTDEQYEKFVRQHIVNKHGIAALANITGQNVEAVNAAIKEAKENKRSNTQAAKPTATADATETTNAPASAKPQNGSTPAPTVAGQKPETQQANQSTPKSTVPANTQGATA